MICFSEAVKMSALSILAEECELLNDSKYRSYITQIEKALKSFDSTSEWADLISALGKLNKVNLAIYNRGSYMSAHVY